MGLAASVISLETDPDGFIANIDGELLCCRHRQLPEALRLTDLPPQQERWLNLQLDGALVLTDDTTLVASVADRETLQHFTLEGDHASGRSTAIPRSALASHHHQSDQ